MKYRNLNDVIADIAIALLMLGYGRKFVTEISIVNEIEGW